MTYIEAIEKVMENNGGFAPIKLIYKEIWKYKEKSAGKTPQATIREKLQRNDKFFQIGVGVWGLVQLKDKLLAKQIEPKTEQEKAERIHAKIQGMLLEMGNERGFDTYTNDKSWIFNNKKLGALCTLQDIPPFTYAEIIAKSVKYIDIAWFSTGQFSFPVRICEVEHSTDFRAALTKFKELEFLNAEFYCIAEMDRKNKFDTEINKQAFKSLLGRVKFETYENVIKAYEYEMQRIRF